MIYGLTALLFTLLVYGPSLWVKFVMWRHAKPIDDMPGTGGELAQHLVEKYQLDGVTVAEGEEGRDHYNPAEQRVSLSPSVYGGKSLTAVAIAAHEIGHAIQFTRDEPVSRLRGKYLGGAFTIKRIGSAIMLSLPLVTVLFKVPQIIFLAAALGVITMLASALVYLAVLPEEYDASFNKALPILKDGYVPAKHIPAIRQVLRAAALTYFAAALADTLNLWRWLRVFR